MLRTFTQHHVRAVTDLCGLWHMQVRGQTWLTQVPGCWEQQPELATYRGTGTYFKAFTVDHDDSTLRLVFKAVSHSAQVFLDDRLVGEHAFNAYIPFDCIVDHVTAGEHTLRVEVDNRFSRDSTLHIPNDYYTYGGITRGVAVEVLPGQYIKQLHATPKQVDGQWTATVETILVNREPKPHTVTLQLTLAGEIQTQTLTLTPGSTTLHWTQTFSEAVAWTPAQPTLYLLKATLCQADQPSDDLIERVGFRTVAMANRKLLLNGEPVFLRGVNRHEQFGGFGCALPLEAMIEDLQRIQALGANAIRTSHYPNDERFLDLCDETGMLVWEEHNTRGQSLEWMQAPNFDAQCAECNQVLITEHYNHPSIVIWGLLNECAGDTPEGRIKYQRQFAQVRELDRSRPLTAATNHHYTDLCLDLDDIVSANIYTGWYEDKPVKQRLDEEFVWIDQENAAKPVIISEFGASGLFGEHDILGRRKWSEERQADILKANLDVYLNDPRLTGIFVWQYADCRVTEEKWFERRPSLYNNKGLVDAYRRPKLAYLTVKDAFTKAKEQ